MIQFSSSSFAKKVLAVAMTLAVVSLHVTSQAVERQKMELIVVAPDGQGFVEKDSGRPFIAFGTNYYDPDTGWAPKIWRQFNAQRVRQHFGVMSELGVNCAARFSRRRQFSAHRDSA